MKRALIAVVVFGLVAVPVMAKKHEASDTSREFSLGEYEAKEGNITVLVDATPAMLHEQDKFFPLHLGMGVYAHKGPITVSMEGMTLIDSAGNSYPMASVSEIMGPEYGKISYDIAFVRQHPLVISNLFDVDTLRQINFYPYMGGTQGTSGELAPFTWFHTLIYFPMPPTKLDGVLTLKIVGSGLDEPIEVEFKVPYKKR